MDTIKQPLATPSIIKYLLELVRDSSRELINIYFDKDSNSRLRFPTDKNNEKRISEQEFRFVFTNILSNKILSNKTNHPLYFSVETPTEYSYRFSKNAKSSRRASSDLSLYRGKEKIMNIEFKSNPVDQYSVSKDIQKLTKENVNGAWIHLIKSENRGTIKNLFEKFQKAFDDYPLSKKPISFHILILESQTLLSRIARNNEIDYSKNIFNIHYDSWHELRDKLGNYKFNNGKMLTSEDNLELDWQIDIFNV